MDLGSERAATDVDGKCKFESFHTRQAALAGATQCFCISVCGREKIETIDSVIFTSYINISVHCHQTPPRNSNIPPLRTFSLYSAWRYAHEICNSWKFDVWCVFVCDVAPSGKERKQKSIMSIWEWYVYYSETQSGGALEKCALRQPMAFNVPSTVSRSTTTNCFFAKLKKNSDKTK